MWRQESATLPIVAGVFFEGGKYDKMAKK